MKTGFQLKVTDSYIEIDTNGMVSFYNEDGSLDRKEYLDRDWVIRVKSNIPANRLPELEPIKYGVVNNDNDYLQKRDKVIEERRKEDNIYLDRIIKGEIKVTEAKVDKLSEDEIISLELWLACSSDDVIETFREGFVSGKLLHGKYKDLDCDYYFSHSGKFYTIHNALNGKLVAY